MANRFQGIADAYARYFHAHEQENLASDPFYQFTQVATQAAVEWANEKKRDNELAKRKTEKYSGAMTDMFVNATDGFNEQTRELAYGHLESFEERMNEASIAGDKKSMNMILSEAQAFSAQLRQGQGILANHAAALNGGTYSEGAGIAKLNKLTNGEYETFLDSDPQSDTYNQLHFRIKDENGGLTVENSFNEFEGAAVPRADGFTKIFDGAIDGEVRKALESGQYKYNPAAFEQLISQTTASPNVVYSLFHDKLLPNQVESIKETYNKNNKNANQSWQSKWNTNLPVNDKVLEGIIEDSGYNELAVATLVEKELQATVEKEFNSRLKAKQQMLMAKQRKQSQGKQSNDFQIGPNPYTDKVSMDIMRNIRDDIKSNRSFNFEGVNYMPQEGKWLPIGPDGNALHEEPIDVETLILAMDDRRGMISNSSMFRSLIPSPVSTKYNTNK